MKKCPYCSEEILMQAIKCKHCHEWLDSRKVNDSSNLIQSISESIQKWKNQRDEKKNTHLFFPTDSKPIVINEWKFYPNHLDVYTDLTPTYDDIKFIVFMNHENSTNGVRTKKNIIFKIYFEIKDEDNKTWETELDLSYSRGITYGKDKMYETILYLYDFISERSFDSRLNWILGDLKKEGLTNLGEYGLDNYGNILDDKNNKLCNFIESFNKGLVEYGTKIWSSHSIQNYDPYTIKIYKTKASSVKLFGFDLNSNLKIKNILNKDVVDFLLNMLINNGQIEK